MQHLHLPKAEVVTIMKYALLSPHIRARSRASSESRMWTNIQFDRVRLSGHHSTHRKAHTRVTSWCTTRLKLSHAEVDTLVPEWPCFPAGMQSASQQEFCNHLGRS